MMICYDANQHISVVDKAILDVDSIELGQGLERISKRLYDYDASHKEPVMLEDLSHPNPTE